MATPKSLATWLQGYGFTENPFALREAGRETRLSEYFVEGPHYDEIKGSAEHPSNAYVFAGRGCGKSAYRVMIQRACRPDARDSSILAIPYTHFDRVLAAAQGDLKQVSTELHLEAILAAGLATLLREFTASPESFAKLSRLRRGMLRTLVDRYAPSLINPVAFADCLHEWGAAEAAEFWEEISNPESDSDPTASPLDPLRSFLCAYHATMPTPLPADQTLADHWRVLVSLVRRIGLQAVYVLVDSLDESAETAIESATSVAAFLIPLVSDQSVLSDSHAAFKLFLPIETFAELAKKPEARFDRIPQFKLEWQPRHLQRMLKERLQAFSNGQISSLDALAEMDVIGRVDSQLIRWAGNSPRRLLTLGNVLLTQHSEHAQESQALLTEEDLRRVKAHFAQEHDSLVPPLRIDEKHSTVLIGGRPITENLTAQEYRLLHFLYQHANELKSRDEIIEAVHGTLEGVSDAAIDSMVFRLRRKIEKDAGPQDYVVTERGKGYRLINVE